MSNLNLPGFTDPSNHEKAEAAATFLYAQAGLKKPEFLWLDSPYKCLKFWQICKKEKTDVKRSVKEDLGKVISSFAFLRKHMGLNTARWSTDRALTTCLNQIKDRLKKELKIEVFTDSFYGIFSETAPALIGVYEKLKSHEDKEILKNLLRLYSEIGWMIPYENVCVLSEKPIKYHINDRAEFHHETEKALEFKDGFGIYSFNGVSVPDFIIEHPETITAKHIKRESNLEIRRIMIDRMGINKYLEAVHAKVIDMDSLYVFKDGDDRTMPRALMEDDEGNKYLVGTDGSTERVYYMRVPPQAMTCKEAHSLIAGFDESSIIANS